MLRNIIFLTVFVFLIGCKGGNYPESTGNFMTISTKHDNYRDMCVVSNRIFAIGLDSQLVVIDHFKTEIMDLDADVVAMNTYKDGIVYAKSTGEILYYNLQSQKTSLEGISQTAVAFIQPIDSNIYLLGKAGISILKTQEFFDYNNVRHHHESVFLKLGSPDAIGSDHLGNIWLGYNFGEFGGEIMKFSTQKKEIACVNFDCYDGDYNAVETFNKSDSGMYVTFSYGHSYYDGIVELTDLACQEIFHRKDSMIHFIHNGMEAERPYSGMEAGPLAYDSKEKIVYVYSKGKIMRGDVVIDLSKETAWTEVLNFYSFAKCGIGELDTVFNQIRFYSDIYPTKLAILDSSSFVFLDRHDGIGVISKEFLTMYQ
jgi:hypothetical protein